MSYICQKCHRSLDFLKAIEKLMVVDGDERCAYCDSGFEHEGVMVRDILYKRSAREGIPLPEWLIKERKEGRKKLDEMFDSIERSREVSDSSIPLDAEYQKKRELAKERSEKWSKTTHDNVLQKVCEEAKSRYDKEGC